MARTGVRNIEAVAGYRDPLGHGGDREDVSRQPGRGVGGCFVRLVAGPVTADVDVDEA
jgi:hypothetical protein